MKIRCHLIFVAMLACLCCSAFSQNSPSCQSDLQNLKLPSKAFIDGVIGEDTPPLTLLFSRDGIDVYSATDFDAIKVLRNNGLSSTDEAMTVIEVYQDEKARLDAIKWFQNNAVNSAKVQNVKFGVFQLTLTPIWIDDVLQRKWMISGYAYYEPYSCVPPEKRGMSSQYGSELCAATDYCPNEIYGVFPLGGLPPKMRVLPNGPNLIKAIDMIRTKLAAYGLPN